MHGWCVGASAVDSVDKFRRMPGVARRGIRLSVLYDAIVLQHEMTHRHTLTLWLLKLLVCHKNNMHRTHTHAGNRQPRNSVVVLKPD